MTMKGLRLLKKNGIADRVCITFTEMKHNFKDIPDLLRLADNMGICQFVTGTLVCGGRATQSTDLLPPTPEQYEKLLSHYQNDKVFRDRYHRIGNIAALEWDLINDHAAGTCCTFIFVKNISKISYLH